MISPSVTLDIRFDFGGRWWWHLFLAFSSLAVLQSGCSAPVLKPENPRWLAALDNGDKPGYAYEFWTREGRITDGNFYLLDMTWEEGVAISKVVRMVFPMVSIDHRDREVRCTFPENFAGSSVKRETTVLLTRELRGGVGSRVPGVAHPPYGPDDEVEIVLKRVE